MGIQIRLFLVIDAFSRISGLVLACSADLSLALAKQRLDSTAAALRSWAHRADVTAGSWRCFRNRTRLSPRITRFLIPANTRATADGPNGAIASSRWEAPAARPSSTCSDRT